MSDWGQYLGLPTDLSVWSFLNSQLVGSLATIFAGVAGLLVSREVSEQAEGAAVQRNIQAAKDRAKESENAQSPVPRDESQNKTVAREVLRVAKDYIEAQIKGDQNGRHQRTYRGIAGHYPDARASALADRDQISQAQADAATELFSPPYSYGRVQQNAVVTREELTRLEGLRDKVMGKTNWE